MPYTFDDTIAFLERTEQDATIALLRSVQPWWEGRVQVGTSLLSPLFTRLGEEPYRSDCIRVEWHRALISGPSIPEETFRMEFLPGRGPLLTGMVVGVDKAPVALESLLLQLVGED